MVVSRGALLFGALSSCAVLYGIRSRVLMARMLRIPPLAVKKEHLVVFGAVSGENRGGNPMQPVKTYDDPYYWMRDDDRKAPEVSPRCVLLNKNHSVYGYFVTYMCFNFEGY